MAGFKPGHDGVLQRVVLGTERGAVAGVAAGHADVDLMALANGERGRGDGGFECGFLGGEVALDIAVVEHAPAVAHGDDGVLRKSHGSLRYFGRGLLGLTSLLLSGMRSRP